MKNEEESNQPMDKTKLPYGRLTFDGNFCDIAKCREERWGKYCPDGACSQRKVWERLKEYEDTTMSPTDVLEYKKFEDELIASGMTFNELLARASTGLRFTSVKDRLPGKDCRCLCAQESMLKSGYVYYEQFVLPREFVCELLGRRGDARLLWGWRRLRVPCGGRSTVGRASRQYQHTRFGGRSMTKKDFSTIQHMLGMILAVALGTGADVEGALLDAVETIDAVFDREILTEDEK